MYGEDLGMTVDALIYAATGTGGGRPGYDLEESYTLKPRASITYVII